jgi:hypothetical protein
MNKDIQIHLFLKREAENGHEHPKIQRLLKIAMECKRQARAHLHLAHCPPVIDPKGNEKAAELYFTRARKVYREIHYQIEKVCEISC